MAQRIKQQRSSKTYLPVLMGGIFILLLGIVIGTLLRGPVSAPQVQTPSTVETIYSSQVLEIASRFVCACGSCGERDLVICSCDTAIQEKNYIRDLIKKGYDPETIIATIQSMFGGSKT